MIKCSFEKENKENQNSSCMGGHTRLNPQNAMQLHNPAKRRDDPKDSIANRKRETNRKYEAILTNLLAKQQQQIRSNARQERPASESLANQSRRKAASSKGSKLEKGDIVVDEQDHEGLTRRISRRSL
jgi:hypothetical protein